MAISANPRHQRRLVPRTAFAFDLAPARRQELLRAVASTFVPTPPLQLRSRLRRHIGSAARPTAPAWFYLRPAQSLTAPPLSTAWIVAYQLQRLVSVILGFFS